MKLVLASDNAHKLAEFRELFGSMDVELISKKESGFTDEVEENGTTFEENAFIKAKRRNRLRQKISAPRKKPSAKR